MNVKTTKKSGGFITKKYDESYDLGMIKCLNKIGFNPDILMIEIFSGTKRKAYTTPELCGKWRVR